MQKKKQELLLGIGKRIVEKRLQLGWSQEALAELAGISQKTVSTAEQGQKALRAENIIAISRALNMDIEFMLTGRHSSASIWEDARLKELNTEQHNALTKIIDAFLSVC